LINREPAAVLDDVRDISFITFLNNSILHERKLQVAFMVIMTGSNRVENPNFSEDSKRAVDYVDAKLNKLRPLRQPTSRFYIYLIDMSDIIKLRNSFEDNTN
jgi:hypothetical protein